MCGTQSGQKSVCCTFRRRNLENAISVAKYENERHMMWHTTQASFKSSLIRSLGPSLEGAIGPPPDGFQMILAMAIMDNVKARYGRRVNQMTFARMEEVLATPLDHVQNLEKHIATQKRHMLMQTSAGYSLEEYRKVLNFRKSVAMHPQIRECLGDCDRKFEDPLLHTYDAIVGYVSTHLPNIRAAAGLSSSAMTGKAFQVSPTTGAPSSIPSQHDDGRTSVRVLRIGVQTPSPAIQSSKTIRRG
jgi:hypothetical protein